ncbi:MAG: class I SAM-dependent methyltransferase [Bacteroidia bacterium]|nr:class I SAM-dependent methyltransferase [Bacteroidia bacterium]
MKKIFRAITPPVIIQLFRMFRKSTQAPKTIHVQKLGDPKQQDLDLYYDVTYAEALEEWGKDNTWNEIQMFLACSRGKILDIACGTGRTIKLLESKNPQCEIYGFDISDLLIAKAREKGIPDSRLKIADATKMPYSTDEFDYSYSIGSLEHFTEEGIVKFISESARVTKGMSFHMIPVSKSGKNEGWMKTIQSFYNNSEGWWMEKFGNSFSRVYTIASKWEDPISFGRWFVCIK